MRLYTQLLCDVIVKGIMKSSLLVNSVLLVSIFACGQSPSVGTDASVGPKILPGLTVPPKPSNGIQVITPIFDGVMPSKDYEVCTWTDAITTQQTDVRSVQGYQVEPPGHHITVYYTTTKEAPGTQRVCTDNDMASFRFLAGAGGTGEINAAPGNLVYRIPAGAQIVLNHHYLNATDQVLQGQSLVNVNFADPGNYVPSGNLAITNTSLAVATGISTQRLHATVDRTYKLWYMIPHMHRWGSHGKVEITRSGVTDTIFDGAWQDSFAFHPPSKDYDPATPYVLHAGDTIDVECTWNNDTGHELVFGFEMCVAFGRVVDDNRAWDNGEWGPF
jgi:hypothetical protein